MREHPHCLSADGGALYLANCTRDPHLCRQHDVTGFPTLIAFRGLGWSEGSRCVTSELSDSLPALGKHVRIDYHGVITVSKRVSS